MCRRNHREFTCNSSLAAKVTPTISARRTRRSLPKIGMKTIGGFAAKQ
jgi:hypothetical protein